MKNIFILFVFALCTFACETETKTTETEDTTVEDLQKAVEEENTAELASFKYVCDHCQIGSHAAGTCPCGMEFEENAAYTMNNSHDLEAHNCPCPHCKDGVCKQGEECKCTDACLMKNKKEDSSTES